MTGDLLQKALAAHQKGDLVQAEGGYRAVLAAQPDHADALSLLAVLLDARGSYDEALKMMLRAVELDPKAALFRINLGNIYMGLKLYDKAADAFNEAIRLSPERPEPYYNLGNAQRMMDQWDDAAQAYRHAIKLAPQHYEARNNLALVFEHQEKYDEAVVELQKLLAEVPNYGDGWLNLCKIAELAGKYEIGLEAGLKAVALMQTNHLAWLGLGVILNRLGRDEQAIEAYQNALKIKPDWAEAWDNLAQTYQALNRLDEAEKAFCGAVEADNQVIKDEDNRRVGEGEYGHRHWHLALLELLKGDLKRGFARYRARFMDVGGLVRPSYAQPVWQGEDIAGKTILVVDEQGAGDCLMMLRYLPLLKKRGVRVKLLVAGSLVPYLQGWDGADELIQRGQPVSDFDVYASIFDLPYCFGSSIETIPQQTPYLPILLPDAETKLDEVSGRKKIAVVWGGAPKHKQDAKRSVPLSILSGIFDNPDIQFYSLNRDKRPGDDELIPTYPLVDLAPRLNSFADGARFIAQMDLIITCDTATAHQAGGMGKKVWTLLPFAPDWRWLIGRDDSPWYPTMRLFRQKKAGDWSEVIARVRDELRVWCEQ